MPKLIIYNISLIERSPLYKKKEKRERFRILEKTLFWAYFELARNFENFYGLKMFFFTHTTGYHIKQDFACERDFGHLEKIRDFNYKTFFVENSVVRHFFNLQDSTDRAMDWIKLLDQIISDHVPITNR